MSKIMELIKAEPVAFQAMVQAGLVMFMGFGLNISKEQMTLVMLFVGAVLTFFVRQGVTPNPEVVKQVEVALNTPPPPDAPNSPMDKLKKD